MRESGSVEVAPSHVAPAREGSQGMKASQAGLVLIAEDDEDSRELMRTLFEYSGLAVAECRDGRAAVADATRLEPDLIVLDGRLPGEDGWTVTRRLRAEPGPVRHTPVVLVTGTAGAESEARAAGCDSFLLKPVNIEELLQTVMTLLARTAQAHSAPTYGQRSRITLTS